MGHFLFFSYSTGDDPEATAHKRQFYDDLIARIKAHPDFRLPDGIEPGFLDADTPPGADWGQKLGSALRTAQVFVYLQEQAYFNFKERPWCGREWHVFRERVHGYRKALSPNTPRPPLMIPIQWQLVPKLPEPVAEIQFKSRDLGEEYGQLGLFVLKSRTENTRNYTTFVANLASHIVGLAKQHQLPPMDQLPSYEALADPFAPPPPVQTSAQALKKSGPRRVDFVYVVAAKNELDGVRNRFEAYDDEGDPQFWKPYFPPTDDTVVNLAEALAHKKKLVPDRLAFGADLIDRLKEALDASRIVILIIDPWSLRVTKYRRIMADYGRMNFWNCVVLVPWNQDQETVGQTAELDQLVKKVFYGLPGGLVRSQIRSSKDFVRLLGRAFLDAQNKIEEYAKVRPVEGPGSRRFPTL